MPTLGEVLREGRHRRNLSLEQAETDTKIRKKYLLALEEGDYPTLPPPVYARGFVQSYAEYLGIDPEFAEKLYEPPSDRSARVAAIRPAAPGFRETRHFSFGAVVTVIAVLAGIAAVVLLYAQYLSYASGSASQFEATPRATPAATATASAAAIALPTPAPSPTPPASPTPIRGVELTVNITERSWFRVTVDGKSPPAFEGVLESGATRTWKANDRIDMRVGNAGGVEVIQNGVRQGKLGASGEVKDITWGR